MYQLKALMEDDTYMLLTQQIFLHLPLIDMLECKFVCKIWQNYIDTLYQNDSSQWLNRNLAKKMSAIANSGMDGSLVQKVHFDAHYDQPDEKFY